jgi:hypothetical protein
MAWRCGFLILARGREVLDTDHEDEGGNKATHGRFHLCGEDISLASIS